MYVLIGMLLIGALLFALWRLSGTAGSAAGRRTGGTTPPSKPPARKPPRGEPLAPDDNPEFLRELDRRARREEDPPA